MKCLFKVITHFYNLQILIKMRQLKDTAQLGFEISDHIIKSVIIGYKPKGDLNQMKTSMAPIIANALSRRVDAVLEQERFDTLIALAKILEKPTLYRAIEELGYKLVRLGG